MPETGAEARTSLVKQRRFSILMSLAVIAFYALGVELKDEASISGLSIKLTQPEYALWALWIIWFWAQWRYIQRCYESLSVLWLEILEDVYAEDHRIAIARAKRLGNRLAKRGAIDGLRKDARIVDKPDIAYPEARTEFPPNLVHLRDFSPTEEGGRKYTSLRAVFRWVDGSEWGTGQQDFMMELTGAQARWLRLRAWIHSLIRLPALSDHVAPIVLAVLAIAASLYPWHGHQQQRSNEAICYKSVCLN